MRWKPTQQQVLDLLADANGKRCDVVGLLAVQFSRFALKSNQHTRF
jgi:hypothetical protein